MRSRSNRKAQSTLEYIIVLTAIVTAIIYAATNYINPATKQALKDAETAIGKAADKF